MFLNGFRQIEEKVKLTGPKVASWLLAHRPSTMLFSIEFQYSIRVSN